MRLEVSIEGHELKKLLDARSLRARESAASWRKLAENVPEGMPAKEHREELAESCTLVAQKYAFAATHLEPERVYLIRWNDLDKII